MIRIDSKRGLTDKTFGDDTDVKQAEIIRNELAALLAGGQAKDESAATRAAGIEAMKATLPEIRFGWNRANAEKLLDAKMDRLEDDVSGELHGRGVDVDPVIRGLRSLRAPPPDPTADQRIQAAQEKIETADNPKDKRAAQVELADAQDAKTKAIEDQQHSKNILPVLLNTKLPESEPDKGTDDPRTKGAYQTEETRLDEYAQQMNRLHVMYADPGTTPGQRKTSNTPERKPGWMIDPVSNKPFTQEGDIQRAKAKHQKDLDDQAMAVLNAGAAHDRARKELEGRRAGTWDEPADPRSPAARISEQSRGRF